MELATARKDRLEGFSLGCSSSDVWVSASIQPSGTAIVPVLSEEKSVAKKKAGATKKAAKKKVAKKAAKKAVKKKASKKASKKKAAKKKAPTKGPTA
jgi:hypothetical protein